MEGIRSCCKERHRAYHWWHFKFLGDRFMKARSLQKSKLPKLLISNLAVLVLHWTCRSPKQRLIPRYSPYDSMDSSKYRPYCCHADWYTRLLVMTCEVSNPRFDNCSSSCCWPAHAEKLTKYHVSLVESILTLQPR